MNRSETIGALATALAAAQGELKPVTKNKTNPHFNSAYADLGAIVEQSAPVLAKHGLAVSQFAEQVDDQDVLTTLVMHKSGEYLQSSIPLYIGEKRTPQSLGSAISYGRRYAYGAMLGVVTDDDDDGQAATKAAESAPRRPRQQTPVSDRPSSHAAPASHETAVADGETGEIKPAYSAEDIARLKREAMQAQGGDRPRITALPEPARVTNLQEKAAQLQQRTRPAPA